MIRGLEFTGFLALAAAVHAGVWTAAPGGHSGAGGAQGSESVTLEASSAQMAALVEAWQRPVEMMQQAVQPAPPMRPDATPVALRPDPAPRTAATPTAPQMAAPDPDLPEVEAAPLSPPAPELSDRAPRRQAPETQSDAPRTASTDDRAPARPTMSARLDRPATTDASPVVDTAPALPRIRPVARPDRAEPRRQPAQSAPALPREVARGTGGQTAGGTAKSTPAGTLDPATRNSLMAQWGGSIRSRIERQKRYPRGTRASGTVHLTLTVSGAGQLLAARVRQSSGDRALDAAALQAVQRARLPSKPAQLPGKRHAFNLPVAFRR
ncbi:gram-negative bacterial tonB protein [Roseovarius sp. A-2]|uniref:energy transducer TonB n=1 Tax=Roseovarius sp. A-2 TaxID=1570360 RepID=UPI0009B54F11|nr:energy transducer TonB [Roseovarius sp. A-2]GAW36753.1 gram-negative bacterial tonB protein [Roseovarius sp. A-2]